MRFNSEKCTFGVQASKFLNFYLTERGIEWNPDKCRAFSEFPTLDSKKSIQSCNRMLTSLSHSVAKSAQYTLPPFQNSSQGGIAQMEWGMQTIPPLPQISSFTTIGPLAARQRGNSLSLPHSRIWGRHSDPYSWDTRRIEFRYQQIEKIALALIYAGWGWDTTS